MEAPLNAREFLKRYHLPQLVRICSISEPEESQDRITGGFGQRYEPESTGEQLVDEPDELKRRPASPGHSNTSISSSFVALGSQLHERSNWTYRRPSIEPEDARRTDSSQDFRSLVEVSTCRAKANNESTGANSGESSMAVRMPRASLNNPFLQVASGRRGELAATESERQTYNEKELKLTRDTTATLRQSCYESIRLAPPSKRPTLSKLHLSQPFLLYKAYKKLELCAYMIDSKNELEEKSGDPIYFPQNYPGE